MQTVKLVGFKCYQCNNKPHPFCTEQVQKVYPDHGPICEECYDELRAVSYEQVYHFQYEGCG